MNRDSNDIIPDHWKPNEALAVYTLLWQLTELVWQRYHLPISKMIGPPNPLVQSRPAPTERLVEATRPQNTRS